MRRRATISLVVPLFLATVAQLNASAAGLGGISTSSLLANGYPTGAIIDTFTHANGTSLAATTDACGDSWTAAGSGLTITNNLVANSGSSSVMATVPLCAGGTDTNEEVAADLHTGNASNQQAGVLLHAKPGGLPSTGAAVTNAGTGSVYVGRLNSDGSQTVWASVSGTGSGAGARFLRLVYLNGLLQVYLNGSLVLSYTETSAQKAADGSYNAVGLVLVTDPSTTFDNFQAYPR